MELDDAYANGAYIDDAAAYPPRWASAASGFRAALGARAEIALPYGPAARQVLDLFHPETPPMGTAIFVHGGYWLKFDRSSWSHLARGLLARGWAVAMPSYDLCPAVPIATITRQIAQAVQYVARHSTGPLSIAGHSAGGHLSARMLDRALIPAEVAARFRTILPISPLSDLRPLRRTSMNADFRMTMADATAESPILMQNRHDARVAIWVGADERPAFLDQARWLAEAWDIPHVIAPGRHHFDVIDLLQDADSDLVDMLTAP
ncbi:alpha/beta hydrolase [Microbulbifer sp. S227A]|uniref:alpha/beta hydrolase n=1 Tax=Microbulbifer sp. S227A TaxID=3415131 RepID=UPI003C79D56E